MDENSCNTECQNAAAAGCVEFSLGKTGTSAAGKCTGYKAQCTHEADTMYDVWASASGTSSSGTSGSGGPTK